MSSYWKIPCCLEHYNLFFILLQWVIQGVDMIVKILLVSCPPHVLANTGGGHEIALFLLISGTLSFQALIKLITMWKLCVWLRRIGKYHLHSSKLGLNTDCGSRSILNPNFSEFRWYFPIRPRQTHSILSILTHYVLSSDLHDKLLYSF